MFVESERKISKISRESKPFPPKISKFISNSEFDNEWQEKSIFEQIKETSAILKEKKLHSKNQSFCVLGTTIDASGPNLGQILNKLKGEIITFYDKSHSKLLVSVSNAALTNMVEKEPPKYFKKYVSMIRPLHHNDQLSSSFEILLKESEKFTMIKLIPNTSYEQLEEYDSLVRNFLIANNKQIFGETLKNEGLIFVTIDYKTLQKLLYESDFIYRVSQVPKGISEKISSSKKAIKAIPQSFRAPTKKEMPIITVMDTGLNEIIPLNGLIEVRDGYGTTNFDDDNGDDFGHGTPIACLSTFGEERREPISKIISYKIWSQDKPSDSFLGILDGIKKYKDKSRIFTSSIGFPDAELEDVYELDRVIQRENIAFVCSAGNINPNQIENEIRSGNSYPNYLKKYQVMAPGNAISSIAVGSIAKNNSMRGTPLNSIAHEGDVSPYSCCGTKNEFIFECIKPDFVEHGTNLIYEGASVTTQGINGITSYTKNGKVYSGFVGTSFSSPLLAKKFAEILAKYGKQIQNIETLKAIFALSSIKNQSTCSGYGVPRSFTSCNRDHALFIAEGIIPLFDKTEKKTTTIQSDEIYIKVPNSSIEKITLCIVHSDDYKWDSIPSLSTFIEIDAMKTGSDSLVPPNNDQDSLKKTNVKLLKYSFEKKSMEATWRFRLTPKITKRIPTDYIRRTNVRYGCAILLSRKSNEASKYSVTREVKAVK
jgi:hypothetical protein